MSSPLRPNLTGQQQQQQPSTTDSPTLGVSPSARTRSRYHIPASQQAQSIQRVVSVTQRHQEAADQRASVEVERFFYPPTIPVAGDRAPSPTIFHTVIQRPHTQSPRSSGASSLSSPRIVSGNTAAASPSPLREGYLQQKVDKENSPMSKQEHHRTLTRPKSKLRLRLKLTPPHPAEVKMKQPTSTNTPTKAPLKISFLASSTRNNQQQDARTVSHHKQETSISTIRGNGNNTPTKPSPSIRNTNTNKQPAAPPKYPATENHFTTHFHSGSPSPEERTAELKEREEKERRTASWFPPIKAIPRSRSAWNLRVEDGKAQVKKMVGGKEEERKRLVSEGRFESDFDGRDVDVGDRAAAQYSSSAASSTLADSHSNNQVYLKNAFAASRTSLSPYIPLETTHGHADRAQHGASPPPPHDALAVITAGHPNDSSSTVNLTLTISDHSSIRSPSPGAESGSSPTAARSAAPRVLAVMNKSSESHSQVSPARSVSSSNPFTLDKSMQSNVGSLVDGMADISASSFAIHGSDDGHQDHLVTPQKNNGQRITARQIVTPSRPTVEVTTPNKPGLWSPYTNGLKAISMDAVNAWSPSKAFAYTDQVAGADGGGKSQILDSSTDESTQDEVLNDSYNPDRSGETSLAEEQREWKSRFKSDESSLTGVTMDQYRAKEDGDSTRSSADDAVRSSEQSHATPEKQGDKSINSDYSAAVIDAAGYMTPQQAQRKRTPEMRRREREASGDVSNDIFSLSDQMLSDRYKFVQEIGFGNWGSVWQCKPRTPAAHPLHRSTVSRSQPSLSHAVASQHHPTKVAIKLVHRSKQATTAARVRALWSEMKIVRSLKADPHPNIIGFDSFIITPSYALIIMPFLAQLMPVSISVERAKGYFKQLTSALAYLHENGITHNDIKPSNIMLSSTNTPIFVDFGFAQKWDVNATDTGANTLIGGLTTLTGHNASCHELFHSEISWGTPEYLDPQRSKGIKHDERASDVWALGVTFFEILIGRTPFEETDDEQFSTAEQLIVYHERTVQGKWLGDWQMTSPMKALLRSMIQPDPKQRITAQMAHHHHALDSAFEMDMSTPPFVRTAASLPIEPREKKQVPREQRDQKRSRALQAETGAKFVKETNDVKVEVPQKKQKEILVKVEQHLNDRVAPKPEILAEVVFEKKAVEQKELESGRVKDMKQNLDQKPALSPRAGPDHKHTAEGNGKQMQSVSIKDQRLTDDSTFVYTIVYETMSSVAPARELRRAASAMALQSDRVSNDSICLRESPSVVDNKQKQPRGLGRQAEPVLRRESQYRQHTRVVSEGCDRMLNNQLQSSKEGAYGRPVSRETIHTRPRSQLGLGQVYESRQSDYNRMPAEKIVHFNGERSWDREPLRQTTRIKDEIAELRNAPSSADIDAKLDRIALWVQDVEHIVEEAKFALEAVQAERPPSRQMLQQVEIERRSQDGLRQSITIVRPSRELRRPSSAMHLRHESNYELRPIIQVDDFRPTHLRRQRSDLTNFRSRADPIVEDLQREAYESRGYDEWPETSKNVQFAKKLKTYRSTGDLHQFADRSNNARERMTHEVEPNSQLTEGWYRYDGRKALLIPEARKGAHESKFKSMFQSVKSMFKRRD
ncbi:hypothetical protein QFC22_004525 [Naganishia vaughanmartiniae]|uniref:Uncharacterized protein n=1 Tax=Naganishia vaughanmartiniae TaxID=1424756 RepID=A0ACC2WZH3_9TREE|nr:hypothetical protein QFC22_004525 [Naganishia vaughanmartiniae]